ncbi:MAG TPA: response regulator [Cyclobacteriaceae bacterium]|nr:response regulator [Cyclobacteriaceae bacterium]
MYNPSVLIIDDEAAIRKMLAITLTSHDYRVEEAGTAKEGLNAVSRHPPDLILLDLGLPDQNGHEVLRQLRDWFINPIIILSVQSAEEEIIQALDGGANDFLTKPFKTGELIARIRAAIRKSQMEKNNPVVAFGDLSIDFLSGVVKKNGALVKLTTTEYALLSLFARNEGKLLTHSFLLNNIWGPSNQNELQYLRVFIGALRKKIENDPNRPSHILTQSGVGYRFMSQNS